MKFSNKRHEEYYNTLKQIPAPQSDVEFNEGGKLIVCLIEFRIMEEIKYVLYALLQVYKPNAIICFLTLQGMI